MKRFTETSKWADPWFQDLPIKYKAFWAYINDSCDAAGVWKCNIRLASFQIGEPFEASEILRLFPIIEDIGSGKWWITAFCEFQYGTLSPDCRPHQNVTKLLASHGLLERVSKGYSKGIDTLKEKEQDKEGDKDKEKEAIPELLRRVGKLFNRRESTPLGISEKKAWLSARSIVEDSTEDDWLALEWTYRQKSGDVAKYRKQDMATLLNNWSGQVYKSKEWKRSDGNSSSKKSCI